VLDFIHCWIAILIGVAPPGSVISVGWFTVFIGKELLSSEVERFVELVLDCVQFCTTFEFSFHIYLLSYISVCGSTGVVDLGRLFSLLIYTQSVGLLGRGDQPVARPLPTHRTTQTQNKRTHRHPCLEWDSNPRSQCSRRRRRFMT
jgi:hypothetical protein